jgi:hypothetical protein
MGSPLRVNTKARDGARLDTEHAGCQRGPADLRRDFIELPYPASTPFHTSLAEP